MTNVSRLVDCSGLDPLPSCWWPRHLLPPLPLPSPPPPLSPLPSLLLPPPPPPPLLKVPSHHSLYSWSWRGKLRYWHSKSKTLQKWFKNNILQRLNVNVNVGSLIPWDRENNFLQNSVLHLNEIERVFVEILQSP